jgi:rRNA maturation endonuclease Nob1
VSPDIDSPLHPIICVIDTSVMIEFKATVGIERQWDLLSSMTDLVKTGRIAFPRQVARELSQARHPDAPGAWIASAKRDVQHPEPAEQTLVRVLQAGQLVDVNAPADREVADPYVAALALEIVERHPQSHVVVVTNDIVDRLPMKIALRTACERLGLQTCTMQPFVDWLDDPACLLQDPPADPFA